MATIQLRPHQLVALAHWRTQEENGEPVAVFDECGLGKSWVACARILEDREDEGEPMLRTLLVVPACILSQWLALVAYFGIADRVRIVSYASIGRRTKTYSEVMGVSWHRKILDEAHYLGQYKTDRHGNFKGSGRARACRVIRATHRAAMTGTPCFSSSLSYQAIASFLGCTEGRLKDSVSIRRRIADIPAVRPHFPTIEAVDHEITDPTFVRRHTEAVDAYIDRRLGVITEKSTEAEKREYENRVPMHRRYAQEIGSLSLRLLRAHDDEAGGGDAGGDVGGAKDQPKVDLVCRLVARNEARKILVFTTNVPENDLLTRTLRDRFPYRSVEAIVGGTPLPRRDQIFAGAARAGHFSLGGSATMHAAATVLLGHRRRSLMRHLFDRVCRFLPPVGSVVVAQLDTCGVGLNLNWAQVAIFARPGWRLRLEHQAVCRLRRMEPGRTHGTKTVHFLFVGRDASIEVPQKRKAGDGGDGGDGGSVKKGFIDRRIVSGRERKRNEAETTLGEDSCAPWETHRTETYGTTTRPGQTE